MSDINDNRLSGCETAVVAGLLFIFGVLITLMSTEMASDSIPHRVLDKVCEELYGEGVVYNEQNFFGEKDVFECINESQFLYYEMSEPMVKLDEKWGVE